MMHDGHDGGCGCKGEEEFEEAGSEELYDELVVRAHQLAVSMVQGRGKMDAPTIERIMRQAAELAVGLPLAVHDAVADLTEEIESEDELPVHTSPEIAES